MPGRWKRPPPFSNSNGWGGRIYGSPWAGWPLCRVTDTPIWRSPAGRILPCLPAPVRWFGGKLHIFRDCGPLRQGDRLTAVCGLPLSAYLERLKSWLSHENAPLLLGRTTCYPQENHFLFSLLNLQAVFGSLAAYELEGERQGERFTVRLSPEPFAALSDAFDNPGFTGGSYIHTRIASDRALFCLDANRDGPEYQQALDDFFRAVTQRGIRRITLDLSRNLGGQRRGNRRLYPLSRRGCLPNLWDGAAQAGRRNGNHPFSWGA